MIDKIDFQKNNSPAIFLIIAVTLFIFIGMASAQSPSSAESGDSSQVTKQSPSDTAGVAAVESGDEEKSDVPERKVPGLLDFLLTGKFAGFLVLMVAGLVLLFARKINIWVRVVMMLIAFVLYGLDYFFFIFLF